MTEPKHARIARYLRGQVAEQQLQNIEVAQRVGMTTSAFSRKINAKTPMSVDEIDSILTALGLTWVDVAKATE